MVCVHAYTDRCKKEWKLAVKLHRDGKQCDVIVAALEPCSRPDPLRPFLYLDFIDGSKLGKVWGVMVDAIRKEEM